MIRPFLADVIFWVGAISCIVAQLAILRSALVAPLADPPESTLPRPRRGVEVAWTIVPAVALMVLLAFTWTEIQQRRAHPTPSSDATGNAR